MEKMNNFSLAGRALRVEVRPCRMWMELPFDAGLDLRRSRHSRLPGCSQVVVAAAADTVATAGPRIASRTRVRPRPVRAGSDGSEPSLRAVGGNMNQITRIELMHKLARTDQPTSLSVTDMCVHPRASFLTRQADQAAPPRPGIAPISLSRRPARCS